MVNLTFVEHNGTEYAIETAEGTTLLRAALDNGLTGMLGECGGELACATCHCYLDATSSAAIPPASQDEMDMLQGALDVTERSRLGCQVFVTGAMTGARIGLPQSQT